MPVSAVDLPLLPMSTSAQFLKDVAMPPSVLDDATLKSDVVFFSRK